MRFLINEKLGPHKYKTPEGYLVCVDAILSRTGAQEYRRSEIFGDACDDPDKIITVDRKVDEVFSDRTMASFENKAICIEHPNVSVNVENHNDLSVGFVRDIHRGEDNDTPVMMGTLVITDKEAVEAIESGEYKQLSCGYDCDIEDEHSPQQCNIRGNHVALCKQGRAGIARIVDSTNHIDDVYTDFEYGYRDGKVGTYNKWYRENRKDEGEEYEMGIQKAKGEGYEIKNFSKGTGDSMKNELLTDMDYRDSIDDAYAIAASTSFWSSRTGKGATAGRIADILLKVRDHLTHYKNKLKPEEQWDAMLPKYIEAGKRFGLNAEALSKAIDFVKTGRGNPWKDSITEDALTKGYTFTNPTDATLYTVIMFKRTSANTFNALLKSKYGKYCITSDLTHTAYGTKFRSAKQFGYDIDEATERFYHSSTKDSVYTVEYVKDNITHIVEVEAKTIADAVIKAKTLFK